MTEQKRSKLAHFLNTTPSATAPTYKRVGNGVVTATMNYGPKTTSETYIHEDAAHTTVDSYQQTLPLEQTAYPGDDVFNFVEAIRVAGPSIGANDLTQLVEVPLWGTPESDNITYPATRWNVAIQIDSVGGEGGGKAKVNYTINILGAGVAGTFNTTSLAFTAN
jgi:hypothetical protein